MKKKGELNFAVFKGIPMKLPLEKKDLSYMIFDFILQDELADTEKLKSSFEYLGNLFFFYTHAITSTKIFMAHDKKQISVVYECELSQKSGNDPLAFILKKTRSEFSYLGKGAGLYPIYKMLRRLTASKRKHGPRKVHQWGLPIRYWRFMAEFSTYSAQQFGIPCESGSKEWTTREPFDYINKCVGGIIRWGISSPTGSSVMLNFEIPFQLIKVWHYFSRLTQGDNSEDILLEDGVTATELEAVITELEKEWKAIHLERKKYKSINDNDDSFVEDIAVMRDSDITRYKDGDDYASLSDSDV